MPKDVKGGVKMGRGSSKLGSTYNKSNVTWNGKTYKTIGDAKLSVAKQRKGFGIPSKTKNNAFLKDTPEINKLPKGWSVVTGTYMIPAGYQLVSNNKSRFGNERETALIKNEKVRKYLKRKW